ncbi:hypothetical protein MKZ38_005180 [Zalerion maritima]|uniref:MHD domain-containing protein n=1 Tax=Zalerion maritima TaxID=339359 RepID=A0AAD5WW90_9PEZI|nr:hypothetical protein MKZ38_005180 [Zalerion maritima]
MNGTIEAIYIFDEHNNPILSHTYAARPLPSSTLLPLYLDHPSPRPNLIYLSSTNPPTLVFSLVHANLLYLLTTTSEIEPMVCLEFLHRLVDIFEEFLGSPLLAHKIESNYHILAQLLTEACDAGTISTTEPNALRDLVEVEGWMNKLLGSISLPGAKQNLVSSFQNSTTSLSGNSPALVPTNAPALPWRRANVRHTSNEMYADVIETLSITVAPSGRPIAAFANGTIAFTAKVSGVPDILVSLSCPTGRQNLRDVMDLPVFHPCVRLQRWRDRPGELSFIPPDGRFVLAGYEVDLLPFPSTGSDKGSSGSGGGGLGSTNSLKLPVNVEVKTSLGTTGADFEVRVHVNKIFRWAGTTISSSSRGVGSISNSGGGGGPGLGSSRPGLGGGIGSSSSSSYLGTPSNPSLEDLTVTIPLPADVRNLSDIRPSKGDAMYSPGDRFLEWNVPTKDLAAPGTSYFGLKCTVVGYVDDDDEDEEDDPTGFGFGKEYPYNEPYQGSSGSTSKSKTTKSRREKAAVATDAEKDAKKIAQNKMLMPNSASVSFAVKGWLPSGIKVDSISIDPRRSKGLGESVKPYKGVKYLTISKGGVEIRC